MMNMTVAWNLAFKALIFFILLLFTVFFVAAETSLTYLRKSQTRRLIKEKGILKLQAWLDRPNRLLTTTLAGTAMSVIGVSVMGTSMALDISAVFDIPPAAAASFSTFIILIIVLVFSEIVPKAYARRNARRVSARIIGPLRIIDFLLTPIISFYTFLSDMIIKAVPSHSMKKHSLFDREELKGLIDVGVREGEIESGEKKMLTRIMEFSGTVVREIMVPRVALRALDISLEKRELIKRAIETGHSRIPVYSSSPDKIEGVLYVKDLLGCLVEKKEFSIKQILRKTYFVPESKPAVQLLNEFRQGREHIAVVVDEYGVTAGIITIEDIVEEITGEIYDEYDKGSDTIKSAGRKSWEIKAIEDLDKINDRLKINLPEDKYDSLGGFILGRLGRVPAPGESIKYGSYGITVLDSTPSRIISVRLQLN